MIVTIKQQWQLGSNINHFNVSILLKVNKPKIFFYRNWSTIKTVEVRSDGIIETPQEKGSGFLWNSKSHLSVKNAMSGLRRKNTCANTSRRSIVLGRYLFWNYKNSLLKLEVVLKIIKLD